MTSRRQRGAKRRPTLNASFHDNQSLPPSPGHFFARGNTRLAYNPRGTIYQLSPRDVCVQPHTLGRILIPLATHGGSESQVLRSHAYLSGLFGATFSKHGLSLTNKPTTSGLRIYIHAINFISIEHKHQQRAPPPPTCATGVPDGVFCDPFPRVGLAPETSLRAGARLLSRSNLLRRYGVAAVCSCIRGEPASHRYVQSHYKGWRTKTRLTRTSHPPGLRECEPPQPRQHGAHQHARNKQHKKQPRKKNLGTPPRKATNSPLWKGR